MLKDVYSKVKNVFVSQPKEEIVIRPAESIGLFLVVVKIRENEIY